MFEKSLRKYPIVFRNQEYEVRWTEKTIYYEFWSETYPEMMIYEVTKWLFGKKYKLKYSRHEDDITSSLDATIKDDDPDYYIEEVKELFRKWKHELDKETKKEIIKTAKEQKLLNWDGIIKD